MVGYAIHPASDTPINGELGAHRRLEWLTMPMEDVREIGKVLGCKVNDVVLATVTGAMRRYLFRRRVDSRKIDFRVAAPVSTRRPEDDRRQGNHVSTWIVRLPLDVEDPIEQVSVLRECTQGLKRARADLALDTVMRIAEWLPAPVISRSAALANGPANMIVTNVPGPKFPLYMVGARLLGLYPLVPLLPGGGLGVALFSYEDKLCWGFNGDYEIVPDLPAFVDDVRTAFEELRQAAVSRFMSQRTREIEIPVHEERPPEPKADAQPPKRKTAPKARSRKQANGSAAQQANGRSVASNGEAKQAVATARAAADLPH
jgi:WS/DGAT/MGAT family acyltransferase